MSTVTYYSTANLRGHIQDVVKTAKTFARALFAAQERQFVAPEIMDKPARLDRARARAHMKLLSMANQYQDMQPSLAAELRQLASRA